MSFLDQPAAPSGTPRQPENRLDSWKAIAAYLGRGVRTVQRWEREEGLPVHRLAHEKRGSVYADRQEIDAWWESRRLTLAAEPDREPEPSKPVVPERITWMSAATFWPAFSSDGRLLAYVSDGGRPGALPQIWLHQVGGSAACLTSGAADRSSLAFSHDDTRIYFTSADASGQHTYVMPTLGGEPRLVKRNARGTRPSPDGKWLAYIAAGDASGVRICSSDGSGDRLLAPELLDIAFAVWSPDSRSILVYAHPDPTLEPDYWIVPIDGNVAYATGILDRMRARGVWPFTLPAAWIGNTLVYSAITQRGVILWRQRLMPGSGVTIGDAEPLTQGEMDSFVTTAGARAGYVSVHHDHNLWSIALDPSTGMCSDAMRRLTRGPGVVAQLSLARDGNTLAYFFGGPGGSGVRVRNLNTDAEMEFGPERGFPALSPSGEKLTFGGRSHGPQVTRSAYLVSLPNGEPHKLIDDLGGRPRQWLDEQSILVERFGARLLSVAVFNMTTGAQVDVLASMEYSITNARMSPDRQWIAFDAVRPGASPSVFVARFQRELIPPDLWVKVESQTSHPFWSADGRFLYSLAISPSFEIRNLIRCRRFDPADGALLGESFTAATLAEMVVSTGIPGSAPVAAPDRILLALADFRGDVWAIDV